LIFVTVGAQMPFDRMVRTVDEWAHLRGRSDVFAQIGCTDWTPRHIEFVHLLEPDDFRLRVRKADVIVAHAGMGSILTALEAGKPILVMPRRGDLKETRNDHQVATARRFGDQGRVAVAMDEHELAQRLDELSSLGSSAPISNGASPRLIDAVRSFIQDSAPHRSRSA
jgi:UDP-N-acetylglucosamine transferase subunit ALG13